MDEARAEAAEVCEHYWAWYCHRGMSIRLCKLCHQPDWDDLALQLSPEPPQPALCIHCGYTPCSVICDMHPSRFPKIAGSYPGHKDNCKIWHDHYTCNCGYYADFCKPLEEGSRNTSGAGPKPTSGWQGGSPPECDENWSRLHECCSDATDLRDELARFKGYLSARDEEVERCHAKIDELKALHCTFSTGVRLDRIVQIAHNFHKEYERLAPDYGYKTREESAVPWEEVPENNRLLMIATVRSLIDKGIIR